MRSKVFASLISCLFFFVSFLGYTQPLPNPVEKKPNAYWNRYFSAKMHEPPIPFVVEALSKIPEFETRPIAMDFGCGVGNETLVLLNQGYHVIAVDGEATAFEFMRKQPGFLNLQEHVTMVHSSFEKLNYSRLPMVDLVVAGFSLPFVAQHDFNFVWQSMISKIKPGGYFIGNFFSQDYSFDSKFRKSMTFLTEYQTKSLFEDFEIIDFSDIQGLPTSSKAVSHHYVVFAQKKAPIKLFEDEMQY
jgi:tellurite methyltransferase